ncbi:MAG: thrombospondin type 3 repeat-containing protein, partial [Pseudomonadota bacterium]
MRTPILTLLLSLLALAFVEPAPAQIDLDQILQSTPKGTGCRLNSDCQIDEICDNGSCVPDPSGGPCGGACGTAEFCDNNTCVAKECDSSLDCPLGELCSRFACVVDLEADRDRDGLPDVTDNCPSTTNSDQADLDRDRQGDA